MDGYYYLHTNGDLIYKPASYTAEDFNSDFVTKYWPMDKTDRVSAWVIILEALALGARIERVRELANKWELTYEDSIEMLKRVTPTKLMKKGMDIFIHNIFGMTIEDYWAAVLLEKSEEASTNVDKT